ncbi:SAF domain-containing protein [Tomitella biformata]|uniref:SAF domain-containing protein n=1 Tax=Tomitella biformata TaxID=630403 RepID=UPI00046401DA|nr:SAF domain-containing protein [Tomitella biformata]
MDDKLAQLLQPGWARTALARRAVAVVLLACAVVLLLRGDPGEDPVPVLIAAHDLVPGIVLTEDDVRLVTRESRTVAEGVLTDPAAVTGKTLAAPLRPGEQITDVRVLGSPLSASVTGVEESRLVPLRLTDAALTDLIHAGDLVDVIAVEGAEGAGGSGSGVTLATAAPVVLVPPPTGKQAARERVILVALPARSATAVATASLTQAITVTLH